MTMFKRWKSSLLPVLVLGLTACESNLTGPNDDESFFLATIEGAISREVEGGGYFILGTDARRPAAPPKFYLFSAGRGASADLAFQLFRPGAELPATGTYSLGAFVGPTGGDLQATLLRTGRSGETLEMYSASEGELEITVSTPDRIEGAFRLSAYLSGLQVSPGVYVGGLPKTADTPTVEVSGTFGADLARSSPMPLGRR
jgi:hypothetical protein